MLLSKIFWISAINYRAGGAKVHRSAADIAAATKDGETADSDKSHVYDTMYHGAMTTGQPWRQTAGVSALSIVRARELYDGHSEELDGADTIDAAIIAEIDSWDLDDPRRAVYGPQGQGIEAIGIYGHCRSLTLAAIKRALGEGFDLSRVEIPVTIEDFVSLAEVARCQTAENELDNAGRQATVFADYVQAMRRNMRLEGDYYATPAELGRRCQVANAIKQQLYGLWRLCSIVPDGFDRLDMQRPKDKAELGEASGWIPNIKDYATIRSTSSGITRTLDGLESDLAATTDADEEERLQVEIDDEKAIVIDRLEQLIVAHATSSVARKAAVTGKTQWVAVKKSYPKASSLGNKLAKGCIDGKLNAWLRDNSQLLAMSQTDVTKMVANHQAVQIAADEAAAEVKPVKAKAKAKLAKAKAK